MKRQNILSGFFVLLLTACSSVTPTPTATATITATITPTVTPSFTPTPTATPTPEFSPEQQAWMDYFSENGYVIEKNGTIKSKNGSIVEGLKLEDDNIVFTFSYPELDGDIFPIVLGRDDVIFTEDGGLDIPAFRFDGQTMLQKPVTENGEDKVFFRIPPQVFIEMVERESAKTTETSGEEKFEEIRNRKIGWTWGSWVFGFNGRTPHLRIQGMMFRSAYGYWIPKNYIAVVDKSGKRIDYVPTIRYAYSVSREENQVTAGFLKTDGTPVRAFIDIKLGPEDIPFSKIQYSTDISENSFSHTPTPTSVTANNPDMHSDTAIGSVLDSGEIWYQGGMEMKIQNLSFAPGCAKSGFTPLTGSMLTFESTIANNTGNEIIASFSVLDISFADNLGNNYPLIEYEKGVAPEKCHAMIENELLIMRMQDGESVNLAFRVYFNLPAQASQIIITAHEIGKIENAKWVIDIPK